MLEGCARSFDIAHTVPVSFREDDEWEGCIHPGIVEKEIRGRDIGTWLIIRKVSCKTWSGRPAGRPYGHRETAAKKSSLWLTGNNLIRQNRFGKNLKVKFELQIA
jgi:hypothetical protein